MTYFFDKSKVALEFLQHRGSKLKFINLERNYQFFFRFSTGNTTYSQSESDFRALHFKLTLIAISALNLILTWITKIGKPNKLFSSNFRVQK